MNKKYPGKLFVIDGTDSTGKATQTDLLVQNFQKRGYKTEIVDFPRYQDNIWGYLIGLYLKRKFGDPVKISPYLASILYAMDRFLARKKMYQWLREGKIIISNRYTTSNQIHQAVKIADALKRLKFMRWLDKFEYSFLGIPRPTAVIYLDVPIEISQKLLLSKTQRQYLGNQKKDGHEENIDYQRRCSEQGRFAAGEFGWHIVNCAEHDWIMPAEKIADFVWQEIEKRQTKQ